MKTTAEEMKYYIDKTKMRNAERYDIYMSECIAIYDLMQFDVYRAICLAFHYGRAKGYRMAKKELRHG